MKKENPDPYQCTGCWYLFFFYFNPENPRIIVPKRFKNLGWTMNLARPMAIPLTVAIIAVALAPFKILDYYGIRSDGTDIIAFIAVLISLVSFCSWMSNPSRFEKKETQT